MVVTNKAFKIYTFELIQQDSQKYEEVFQYIRMYGVHAMAYSILQPKMNYFIIDGVGLVAYAKKGKRSQTRFVLSDPLVSRQYAEYLLQEFLKVFPNSCFVQVSERIALLINKIAGFYATPMGIETSINLNKFKLKGYTKKELRNQISKCEKENIQVLENNIEIFISNKDIYNISKSWLSYRKEGKKEVSFLARPFSFNNLESRTLIAINNKNNIVGFVIFTPIYENNRIIAYVPDMIRTISEATRGTGDYIIYKAINKFKLEGLNFMPLGLSPLYKIDMDSLNLTSSKLLVNMLKLVYKKGNSLYNFVGLAKHKKQFEGKECSVYFCHKEKFPVTSIVSLFKLSNTF